MVDDAAAIIESVVANGGQIVQPIGGGSSGNYRKIHRSGRKYSRAYQHLSSKNKKYQ